MKSGTFSWAIKLTIILLGMMCMFAGVAHAQRYMEKLSRGLIAVKSVSGYFLSWRLFGTEYGTDIGFNVYKGTDKINSTPITNATCFQDNSTGTGDYSVRAVVGGQYCGTCPFGSLCIDPLAKQFRIQCRQRELRRS